MAEDLAALGLAPQWDDEPPVEPPVEVYAENWWPTMVIIGMSTQWHRRPDGRRDGMRYGSLPIVLDMVGVPAEERGPDLYAAVRILERDLLDLIDEGASRG